jgi:gluconolactonase
MTSRRFPRVPPLVTDTSILDPTAELEQVFGGAFYTEGPAKGPDGRIYFCDLTFTFRTGMAAGNIWVFDPPSGRCDIYRSPSGMASGIKFDRDGRMVIATGADFGSRAIIRTDLVSGRSHIMAGLYNGRPFNAPNDLVIDDAGRIYFTDPRYVGHEPIEQPVFGVYRIDTDGSVHLVLADVSKPNGIDLSPDQKTLYVVEHDIRILDRRLPAVPICDHGEMRILAYDLTNGVPVNRRTLVDFGGEKGADGIAVDAAGNIYAAVQSKTRPGIRIFGPDGRQKAEILTPETPANCTLIETPNGADLYITACTSLYRIGTKIPPPVAEAGVRQA